MKEEDSHIIIRLHNILLRFDKIFAGRNRANNLTLYEYINYLKEQKVNSEEIEFANRFIKEYCLLRYGHKEIFEGDFSSLEKKLDELEEFCKK